MTEPADQPADRADLDREIASCIASERSHVAFVRGLGDVDPSTPSRLPGWTVGHVMTHIARNGDGVLSVLAGHPQYPHGVEGRNRDIELGSAREWPELVADVAAVSDAVVAALGNVDDWTGTVSMLPGERRTSQLPLLRQREIEIHRIDLGLGAEFADLPGDYVRRELRVLGMLWTARQPMGLTALPEAALALEPPTRLAWLLGRADIEGLDPAGVL